jgi:hypothetical protein
MPTLSYICVQLSLLRDNLVLKIIFYILLDTSYGLASVNNGNLHPANPALRVLMIRIIFDTK